MKIFTHAAIIILIILIGISFNIRSADIGFKLYILCGYIVLGGSSKYIDEAYDESIFDKKIALFLAAISMFLLVSLVVI